MHFIELPLIICKGFKYYLFDNDESTNFNLTILFNYPSLSSVTIFFNIDALSKCECFLFL